MAVTWHLTLRFGDEIYKEGDCLSTDTKPVTDTTLMNGSKLTEIDTADVYRYDKENTQWRQCGSESGGGSGGGVEFHICTSGEYNTTTGVPTVSSPGPKTFYLVPDGSGNDLFVEWIYVNNAWEKFASARVDLSGYVTGVQVNGTSVVQNGVANVPVAGESTLGVIKVVANTGGLYKTSGNELRIASATDAAIKGGNNDYRPIVSANQHKAAFYGLAKAAGDSTQAASNNAVGTYTADAKTAIKSMLGINDGGNVSNPLFAYNETYGYEDFVMTITGTPGGSWTADFSNSGLSTFYDLYSYLTGNGSSSTFEKTVPVLVHQFPNGADPWSTIVEDYPNTYTSFTSAYAMDYLLYWATLDCVKKYYIDNDGDSQTLCTFVFTTKDVRLEDKAIILRAFILQGGEYDALSNAPIDIRETVLQSSQSPMYSTAGPDLGGLS